MKMLKNYKWVLIFTLLQLLLVLYNQTMGEKAFGITLSNLKQMMMLIPPIFIIMGLVDVWIPKETLIRYMGAGSGIKGILIALLLGTLAAGPIYIAFPMGILLLKKGAKLSNVIFFFGVWSSTKLPVVLYEIASFGIKFTVLHILVSLSLYLAVSYYIENAVSKNIVDRIVSQNV